MPRKTRKMMTKIPKGKGRAVGVSGASRLTTKRPRKGIAGGRGY